MTESMKHPIYGKHWSKYTLLFIQCNFFNIYMKMGNRNGNGCGPFLRAGRFQTSPGQGMTTVSVPQAQSQHPEGLLHSAYLAQTFLLPTAQLQTAPAHREKLMVCSRHSLRLLSLPLFTFLKHQA